MRIASFFQEFTNDLESFVKTPIHTPPLAEWNPFFVASPERHVWNGVHTKGLDSDTILYMLGEKNQAFERIGSMLRIYLDPRILKHMVTIDPVHEQTWLFGYKWFSIYYELLAEPDILRSDFYRNNHDDFLSLMGKMLMVNPTKRIRPLDALRIWFPTSTVCTTPEEESEEETVTSKDDPSTTPLPTTPSVRRLVLNGCSDLGERNKTRKNLRS